LSSDFDSDYDSSFQKYVYKLFDSIAESNDYFISSQIKRLIVINIQWNKFRLSPDEILYLYIQGENAVDLKLNEFDNNFNRVLINENKLNDNKHKNFGTNLSTINKDLAEKAAKHMIENFADNKEKHVFLSYAHEDREWIDKFNDSFIAMDVYLGITTWSDLKIFHLVIHGRKK